MSLEEEINGDIKTAMREKAASTLRALRAIKNALLLAKTDGSGEAITEEREIQILQKLLKQRRESLEIYEKQNREDLADKEKEEIEVIQQYLPKPLSDDELQERLEAIVDELQAETMKDMGTVIGKAKKELAGKAEPGKMAQIIKSLLS
ncbi:MAG: GatB/YqeY domain-containing protein [Bacteroidetes bacterium]|jgi:uncharacterized protein YqeY|nr:GatB/YqeY domain-containing protein [Bacteroidota bacterium]